jgi:thymidylate synthase
MKPVFITLTSERDTQMKSTHFPLEASDINAAIKKTTRLVSQYGTIYQSGDLSMNRGNAIQEIFNTTLIWHQPRCRIFVNNPGSAYFRIGLAVARFFYLLSGSNHLAPISFYSPSVARFSDDGLTIPGSSYGHRIFGDDKTGGQFELIARLISQRPETKRGEIAIYQPSDAGRDSKDIPCASALVFMPRNHNLHMTLQMRANDAVKLLPYNLFEFSLLGECMAAQTHLALGDFHHTAVSLHLRGQDISTASTSSKGHIKKSPEMLPITTFSNTLRIQLIEIEHLIRTQISHLDVKAAWEWFNTLSHLEPIWQDLIGVLLLEALRCVQNELKDIQWLKNHMLTHDPLRTGVAAYALLSH